jgi:hypothetical protein
MRLSGVGAIIGVVAASALALAGCGSAGVPAAGLTVIGGKPTIVFVSCTQRSANVGVYVDKPTDPSQAGPRPSDYIGYLDWTVRSSSPERLTEIPLFGAPPPRWIADENAITTLQPGVTYSVTGTGEATALPVRFTVDDLARLNADRVMVGNGPGKSKVVSRKQFEDGAC